MDFLALKDCFRGRGGDLAQVLSTQNMTLIAYRNLDYGNATESSTHSIARALFPCHQTDSRSVGNFVPVDSGTEPAYFVLVME